jgi:DnaJ family protein C protein 2
LSYSFDPRIKRIRQQEKEARDAKKRGLANGSAQKTKEQVEEEKRKAEQDAKQTEEAEKVGGNAINIVEFCS